MNKTLLAISLIILGLLLILRWLGFIHYETEAIFGIILTAYGLLNSNISLEKNNRRLFAFSSILFLIGIALVVKSIYDLPDTRGLVLVSILFISGAVLFILFLENSSQKVFLWGGALLVLLSIFSLTFLRMIGLFRITNKIADLFEIFWPIVLTLFGMSLFINRKK